jgi:putative membrane-bound dehydrogenase-like protein
MRHAILHSLGHLPTAAAAALACAGPLLAGHQAHAAEVWAPDPAPPSHASPLTPQEELASFSLPPGFVIDLVAAESEGVGKFVAIDWDLQGRLWTMTALEYPVDANESPAAANELYASHAKDKVLVFDRDPGSPTGYASAPRVFADGLAIPLGILPFKSGVYAQHGPDIVFLSDSNGDGRADRRETILSGFGVQDSHLFPHQFTRAPGNWIWMAQGAFNYGKVRTTGGEEQQFDQTRMAKFRYDGSEFDITSQGPCNIWGLALTTEGEAWIQEANDFGYPAMLYHEYANYPGCSEAQWKSYAPEFPSTAPDFRMGGTGLSGLALSDAPGWPEPFAGVLYVANPITRRIQALRIDRDGPRPRLHKLPDFVLSSDEWFRPIALRTGPDGCLYIVDWYNKIISHNEVPRNHPERDKRRGRIWRVRHRDVPPTAVPDFTQLPGTALMQRLGRAPALQSHLAWQAITDRQLRELAPALESIASADRAGDGRPEAARIAALWALEGLASVRLDVLGPMLRSTNPHVRRESVRALAEHFARTHPAVALQTIRSLADDRDPAVRAEVIRAAGRILTRPAALAGEDSRATTLAAAGLLAQTAKAPLAEPTAKSTHSGRIIKIGDAYEREFERYLARLFLERQPAATAAFLETPAAASLPLENRLVAILALDPKTSAPRIAADIADLRRPPGDEEVLRLAMFPEQPGVGATLARLLQSPPASATVIQALLRLRNRLDPEKLAPVVTDAARGLLTAAAAAERERGARLASAFRLTALEPELTALLQRDWDRSRQAAAPNNQLDTAAVFALRALRESSRGPAPLFETLARESQQNAVRDEAVAALAASRAADAPDRLLRLWPELSAAQRRVTLAALTSTPQGASAVVTAVRAGALDRSDLDPTTLDRLQAVLGTDAALARLLAALGASLQSALRLDGTDAAWVNANMTLDGPFTVETWVRLDPGIDNRDGVLGAPGVLDMNFHDGRFRVWVGGQVHDAVIASKKTVAELWTHLAVSRDAAGILRIFLNGELDATAANRVPQRFEHARIGWTGSAGGTAGWLAEFRVWDRAREAAEIRTDFDRSYAGEARPAGLRFYASADSWGTLEPGAKIAKTTNLPHLVTGSEARDMEAKFTEFRALAEKPGDAGVGRAVFAKTCMSCHSVAGEGGQIGPVLSGAGVLGTEALLRNLLTPHAAMEPGYRMFRVELKNGDVVDGLLVSQDAEAIVLRRQNAQDLRLPQADAKRAAFTRLSVMPEGLLEGLPQAEVTDLFAYLRTLK